MKSDKFNIFKKYQIKKKNKNNFVVFTDRGNFDSIIKIGVLSNILSKTKYLEPLILHKSNLSEEKKNLYKKFGIEKFYNLDDKKYFFKNFFFNIYYFSYTLFYLLFNDIENFINKFDLKNCKIGDLIYDSYIRHKRDFYNPKKFSLHFLREVFISIVTFNSILHILKFYNNRVKKIVITQFCYSNISTLLAKQCLNNKIKTFLLSGPSLFKIENYDAFIHPFCITKKKLDKTEFKSKEKKIYHKYLKRRFSGKVWTHPDVAKAYSKRKSFTLEMLLQKLSIPKDVKFKKIILFGCHAFKDAPHSTGKHIFRDYFDHLDKTIEFIKHKKDFLWIFKPHPSRNFFNEDNFLNDYFKKKN